MVARDATDGGWLSVHCVSTRFNLFMRRFFRHAPLAVSVVAASLVFAAATRGSDASVWRGDFETGDLSQWDGSQSVGTGRISLEQSIVRQGRYAARFEVKPGDHWAGLVGGERAEVLKGLGETSGHESYWAWSTYFPASFVSDHDAGFQMFTQWHSSANDNNSGISFQVHQERLVVRFGGGVHTDGTVWRQFDLGPLIRSVWQDFIVHVRWGSSDDGFIDVWRNGKLVVSHAIGPNIGIGLGTYVKQGFYRPPEKWPTVVYQDAMRYGTSLDQVAGPFELRFVGQAHRAKGRVWFHVRSFANTVISLNLSGHGGHAAGTRTVETNGEGEAWSSLACEAKCASGRGRVRVVARAEVDPSLPDAAKSTQAPVR
jgi:hypothetical protein